MKRIKYKTENRKLKIIFFAMLFLVWFPVIVISQETNQEEKKQINGQKLYEGFCAPCHGFEGDGKGYAINFTFPKPRNFASGIYKFRSTPSGEPPTDNDLIRSIKKGNPGTSMSAWEKKFSDDEIKAIVEYIKGFAKETFEFQGEPIEIGEAPPVTDELIEKGRKLFVAAKCWECHGKLGRGDGEKGWQEKFKDDWGNRIYPTNLTHLWELRNGSSVEDICRSITTGLDGTPMASYQSAYSDDDRWALAHYLRSLQIERKLNSILKLKKVENIPSSTEDELWEKVDYIDLQIEGKKLFGESFIPRVTNVRVRGLYKSSEIAIMLEWADKMPNKADNGFLTDAVQLRFPVISLSTNPASYKEVRELLVNIWYWKASDNLALELNAKGPREDQIIKQEKMDVKAVSSYNSGLYRVIFKRNRDTKDKDDITFKGGEFIPFSVIVYDGQNYEEGSMGGISSSYHVMLD